MDLHLINIEKRDGFQAVMNVIGCFNKLKMSCLKERIIENAKIRNAHAILSEYSIFFPVPNHTSTLETKTQCLLQRKRSIPMKIRKETKEMLLKGGFIGLGKGVGKGGDIGTLGAFFAIVKISSHYLVLCMSPWPNWALSWA